MILKGTRISPGLGLGRAYIQKDVLEREHPAHKVARENISSETDRFAHAVESVRRELNLLADRVEKGINVQTAMIFRVQAAMLADPLLIEEVKSDIQTSLENAEHVVKSVFFRWARGFQKTGNEVIAQRTADLKDLCRRLLVSLSGAQGCNIMQIPEGSVIVASHMLPSEAVLLSKRIATAVILESGGSSSHTAMILRELGIPAVGKLKHLSDTVQPGNFIIVDGLSGTVVIEPDVFELATVTPQRHPGQTTVKKDKRPYDAVATTADGVPVEVMANVNCREDAEVAARNGADGIGLFRLERFYLASPVLPSEMELLDFIGTVVAPFKGRTTTVRLLDIGADKKIPYLNLSQEHDPNLGQRGVRVLLRYPELLFTQLRTMLILSKVFSIRILVPMVVLAEDMAEIRKKYLAIAGSLNLERLPPLGAMIETPAAALCAGDIAPYADFFSIGSNDLTQYAMAAGRDNDDVERYFLQDHPAVYKLMCMTVKQSGNLPVSLCGEIAGNARSIRDILKTGIRNVSVAPGSIREIKEEILRIVLQHHKGYVEAYVD